MEACSVLPHGLAHRRAGFRDGISTDPEGLDLSLAGEQERRCFYETVETRRCRGGAGRARTEVRIEAHAAARGQHSLDSGEYCFGEVFGEGERRAGDVEPCGFLGRGAEIRRGDARRSSVGDVKDEFPFSRLVVGYEGYPGRRG